MNPFRSPYTGALTAVAIAAALALSVEPGLGQRVGHDFHVFWQAGRNYVVAATSIKVSPIFFVAEALLSRSSNSA